MQRLTDDAGRAARIRAARLWRLRRLPLLSPRLWLRRLVFWGGAVLVAGVAIAFANLANAAVALGDRLMIGRLWLALLLPPAGFAFSVLLTQRVFPGAQGSGIPQTIAALRMTRIENVNIVLAVRIAVGKVVLTLLGLVCGASIGREGPTVQIGAAIMHGLGRLVRLPNVEVVRAVILAGGAAGIAAAFNTPLAGIVFAIEELSHSFEARTSGNTLTAVIIAGITTLALAGNYTYFGVNSAQLQIGEGWIIAVLLCGVCGGIAGGLFSFVLVSVPGRLRGGPARWLARHPIAFAAGCGLLVALIGLASGGATYGTGYQQARGVVEGTSHLAGSFVLLKFAANVASYLSGMPGGIFAPTLAVGAGLGQWLSGLIPEAPAQAVVLLGMVGYFSGVVQAPITSFVIVMEMTDNQQMTIPLMATAVIGFAVSRLICARPIYEALSDRFLAAMEH